MACVHSIPPETPDEEDYGPATMSARVLEAWRDMALSTRRLILENPAESRLLFYVILADMIFFLSWTVKTVLAPTSAAAAQMPWNVGGWILVAFLMRTALMYVFAAAACALCRMVGGTGSWRDTRAAIFWGGLVAAPFGLLASALAALLAQGERSLPQLADPIFALPPYYIGLVPFLWFIAAGIATVQEMRVGWIFLVLSAGTVALSILGVYLTA